MSEKVIQKNKMVDFLNELLKAYKVFAPVKRDHIVSFDAIQSSGEMLLNYLNSRIPPKEIFFPRSEKMFEYIRDDLIEVKEVLPSEERKVLFGIRPCDAKAILLLDKVFDSPDYQDPYYLRKRKETIFVGMGCDRPQSTCFCTSLGGAPFSEEGLDLLFTNIGDRFVVKGITEEGETLLEKYEQVFERAKKSDLDDKLNVEKEAVNRIKSKIALEKIEKRLDKMFEDSFWDRIYQKCLGCAVCTYLCPTCHCFDITDETMDTSGERFRAWDSCQFALFTLQASGHNPRMSGKERVRQRIMHKFNYFVKNYGEIACVGCGRCIKNCPVNFDIRQILLELVS